MANSRTAMQLMLWYLENEGLEDTGVYFKAKQLLDLEKEQITEANNIGYECGYVDNGVYGERYYNEKYGK